MLALLVPTRVTLRGCSSPRSTLSENYPPGPPYAGLLAGGAFQASPAFSFSGACQNPRMSEIPDIVDFLRGLPGFDQTDIGPAFGEMQRGGQAGIAAADHCDFGPDISVQRRIVRLVVGRGGPQAIRQDGTFVFDHDLVIAFQDVP